MTMTHRYLALSAMEVARNLILTLLYRCIPGAGTQAVTFAALWDEERS